MTTPDSELSNREYWDWQEAQVKWAKRDREIADAEAEWQAWNARPYGGEPEPRRNPYHVPGPRGCERGRWS